MGNPGDSIANTAKRCLAPLTYAGCQPAATYPMPGRDSSARAPQAQARMMPVPSASG